MALTKIRIGKQLAASANPRSILITDGSSEPAYHAPTTGGDSILFWDDSASNWAPLTMGAGVAITGTVLSATGTAGYGTVQEEGTPLTARNTINFIGSGITAADNAGNTRTDVTLNTFLNTLATSGAVNLSSHVTGDLPFSNLTQIAGLSVLGVAGSSTADVAAITAASDHQVLRRSGSSIAWGAINLAQSNAVTGVLDETNGGTGLSSYSSGSMIYASGANTLAERTIGSSGNFLRVSGGFPTWTTAASTDLSDSANIAMLNENETVSGTWTFSNNITVPATPTNSTHATSKQYVDNLFQGVRDYKESVRAASTANVSVTYNATGGASARGQITAAPNTLNGVSLAANDRILLKNQSTGAQNGIWVVTTLGSGANGVWDRATDFDSDAEVTSGATLYVSEHVTTDNRGTYVLTTSDPITIGGGSGTALTFTQINSPTGYVAGNGLTLTGLTFDVGTASATRIVVNADNIDLATTAATPGSFGSASTIPVITVDAYGRLTASADTAVLIGTGNILGFQESVEDIVGTMFTDSATIDFTYTDNGGSAGTLTAAVIDASITFAKIQNISTDKLIGRDAAGSGVTTEIGVTNGLAFTGSNSIGHSTTGASSVTHTGAQVPNAVTIDSWGHVTGFTTRNLTIDDLNDVTITTPSSGQVLSYNGSAWVNSAASGSITEAYTETLNSSSISLNSGTAVQDAEGTNIAFTTPSDKTKLFIYRNGVMLSRSSDDGTTAPRDYTVNTSTHVVTFAVAVVTGEQLKFVKFS